MIRVIIAGIAGRMGSEIARQVHRASGMEIIGGFERAGHSAVSQDIGSVIGMSEKIGIKVIDDDFDGLFKMAEEADVVIDFTHPDATMEKAGFFSGSKTPMVIGTTGLTPHNLHSIGALCNNVAIVQSFNMSTGMNILFKLVQIATTAEHPEIDVEIIEKHHRMKKDAPSGSAVRIGQLIAEVRGTTLEQVGVYERHGMIGERGIGAIGLQTIRGGNIIGEHTVHFIGDDEILEITHKAQDRSLFAKGAVRAAKWVVEQPAGLYSMFDVLGLDKI